jgi:hypothetical protein
MAALLRTEKNAQREKTEKVEISIFQSPVKNRLPSAVRVSLFASDFLLCTLVLSWAWRHGGSLNVWELILCACSILLGAWLSVIALWDR